VARAEGVPFFLEELARAVADHPDLRSDVMVPDTIQGVLEARLDRLPDAEKQLLQVASVIGKDVPVSLLQAVAGVPEAGLRRSLSRLQATEFIYLRKVSPAEEYTFKHALTHDVIYESLLASRISTPTSSKSRRWSSPIITRGVTTRTTRSSTPCWREIGPLACTRIPRPPPITTKRSR
jgi:hypothetical protein